MTSIEIEIINKLGLHARAASKLSAMANRFKSHIEVEFAGKRIDAKSIMSLMLLAAAKGSVIQLHASGDDEDAALTALSSLINDRFDEDE